MLCPPIFYLVSDFNESTSRVDVAWRALCAFVLSITSVKLTRLCMDGICFSCSEAWQSHECAIFGMRCEHVIDSASECLGMHAEVFDIYVMRLVSRLYSVLSQVRRERLYS